MSTGDLSEADSWRLTALVMLAVSATVFIVQRFVTTFLDPLFELCVFHLPTVISIVIYLRSRSPDHRAVIP